MNLLIIDTSTEACSLALKTSEGILTDHKLINKKHNELILSKIDALLHRHDLTINNLDFIAYGLGPGSFVGVRIAASIVQGLSMAPAIPVVGFSSMHAIAESAYHHYPQFNHVTVLLDAKMQTLYQGQYRKDPSQNHLLIQDECAFALKDMDNHLTQKTELLVGDGVSLLPCKPNHSYVAENRFYPQAHLMLPFVENAIFKRQYDEALNIQPVYLHGTKHWQHNPN
jgi:tRNA threonylcarbamoyladenosine biosynthesis protein TsaB